MMYEVLMKYGVLMRCGMSMMYEKWMKLKLKMTWSRMSMMDMNRCNLLRMLELWLENK